MSDTIREGSRVGIILQFDYQRPEADSGTRVLNPIGQWFRFSVLFRSLQTTREYERHYKDFSPPSLGSPGCEPPPVFPPLQSVDADTFYVHLLSEGRGVPPGDYDVRVTYANDGSSRYKPDPADAYRGSLWAGTIESPPIRPPMATSNSPTCGRVKLLHPEGNGTSAS